MAGAIGLGSPELGLSGRRLYDSWGYRALGSAVTGAEVTLALWGNSVKNYPFSAGNAQNGGVLEKKSGIFVFFWGLGAFRPPNSAKLFLGQPHYSALRKKKSPHFFFQPPMGPTPRQTTFYRNQN